jgi:uncharacterized protein YdaU (DUF1376 family)
LREIIFFRHYITELENPNISAIFRRHGAKGYGLYWHLMERLYSAPGHQLRYDKEFIANIAKATKLSKSRIKAILSDFEALRLIGFRGENVFSGRVDHEVHEVIQSKLKREKAARPA